MWDDFTLDRSAVNYLGLRDGWLFMDYQVAPGRKLLIQRIDLGYGVFAVRDETHCEMVRCCVDFHEAINHLIGLVRSA